MDTEILTTSEELPRNRRILGIVIIENSFSLKEFYSRHFSSSSSSFTESGRTVFLAAMTFSEETFDFFGEAPNFSSSEYFFIIFVVIFEYRKKLRTSPIVKLPNMAFAYISKFAA